MRQIQGAEFTKAMKKTHTILLPNMLGYHNELLKAAFAGAGYHLEIMDETKHLPDKSLPYINGDYCLPAVLILGQMLSTISSGKWDIKHIAFMEPQTGGACRAGNYYNSMITCLRKAGYEQIPVISLNAFGEEKHSGFSITLPLLLRTIAAVCYGDLLMTLLQQVRPYEKQTGVAEKRYNTWMRILCKEIRDGKKISRRIRQKRYEEIISSFAQIPTIAKSLKKVGITGEIYIKFSKIGNDYLEDFLQKQQFDYRMGGFMNYAIYVVDSEKENQALKGAPKTILKCFDFVLHYMKALQKDINTALQKYRFVSDESFDNLVKLADPIISKNCNTGDGWLIAGEVADLVSKGYNHILILHPFGCLVSHICERGILKKFHTLYPNINIQTIEYDYDSSKSLRESRVLLGLSDIALKP